THYKAGIPRHPGPALFFVCGWPRPGVLGRGADPTTREGQRIRVWLRAQAHKGDTFKASVAFAEEQPRVQNRRLAMSQSALPMRIPPWFSVRSNVLGAFFNFKRPVRLRLLSGAPKLGRLGPAWTRAAVPKSTDLSTGGTATGIMTIGT